MNKYPCIICKKNMGFFENKFSIMNYRGSPLLPDGLTENDKVCKVCFDKLKNGDGKHPKEEQTDYKDKLARIFVPEAKYVYDSKKRGTSVKCPRCGKILPKHSLTCIAKTFANPFTTVKMGQDFAKETENAYCPKCDGFLPEHKDECPLKKSENS